MLITPNATVLRKKIEIILPLSVWEWQEISPNPNHMGRIAAKHLDANHYSLDGRLELLYLRRTQAEIEKGSVEEGLRNSKKAGF